MVTEAQVAEARQETDAALEPLQAARAIYRDATAAASSARDEVLAALPVYNKAHATWTELRAQYLREQGAIASQQVGGGS